MALDPLKDGHQTVDVAWALAALTLESNPSLSELRHRVARRLMDACRAESDLFPHTIHGGGRWLRAHVSSFADQIYPIHALSAYAAASADSAALEVARKCARRLCALRGEHGQWWWHYDCRTGRIVERYPVYAIHQDAMGPMGLFALQDASGLDFTTDVASGVAWLEQSPELGGNTLVDDRADLIWRKVARREPWKLARSAQAIASRLHSGFRLPWIDALMPPTEVDYEDRPYHLGWLLYAWSSERVQRWEEQVR
jgi:hypothetical protein